MIFGSFYIFVKMKYQYIDDLLHSKEYILENTKRFQFSQSKNESDLSFTGDQSIHVKYMR